MVEIDIGLTNDEFLDLALLAHEQDITVNHLTERLMSRVVIDLLKKEIK